MQAFKDTEGREWIVSVNVTSLKRVKGLLGVDLLSAFEPKSELLQRLITEPILLVDVVYVVCKEQADTRGVTDEDFGRAMAGDPIEAAMEAVFEELASFSPRTRQLYRKALAKLSAFQAKAIQLAETKLNDPKLESQLQAILSGNG
jgi:hypothetical protein